MPRILTAILYAFAAGGSTYIAYVSKKTIFLLWQPEARDLDRRAPVHHALRPARLARRSPPGTSAARSRGMSNALGIGGSFAGGLLEFARGNGGMVKRLLGASEAGVLAASLAADGFAGPRTVLEGEFGFLKVFCTKWDEAELTRGLGEDFVVSSTVLKRYPCHATAHAAVRAVRDLQAAHGLSGPDVEAVTVNRYRAHGRAPQHPGARRSDAGAIQHSVLRERRREISRRSAARRCAQRTAALVNS